MRLFWCSRSNESADKITGANAGGPRQLFMQTRWAAPALLSSVVMGISWAEAA
jgi:hypothetical protein